jgi:glutamine---fructose-6-phosphate transaminase (isomerizing)
MISIAAAELDGTRPTPLYLQLAELLRRLINDGAARPGEALPSERALADDIGVSRVTVRKALDILLSEGLLSRRQGSGTYVAARIEPMGEGHRADTPHPLLQPRHGGAQGAEEASLMRRSAMALEALESAACVSRLVRRRGAIHDAARRIDLTKARVAVICGRGSSGHAGVHLRYLIETRLGLPVSATAPSVTTAMRAPLKLEGALFIVISQSGASPDLVAATQAAREAGAQTIAVVNVEASPVACAAEHVIALDAGPELAVAATKSVIASLAAGVELVAALAGETMLERALDRLPDRLAEALALDWSVLQPIFADAPCAFVAARGFGLGAAREIALKCAETLRLPTLAYSAAELLHGPRASLTDRTPVLAFRICDETGRAVDSLAGELRAAGVPLAVAGGPAGDLPWIGDDHPVTDAIAMLAPAYLAIEAMARARGLDPDNPPFLSKVTRTL